MSSMSLFQIFFTLAIVQNFITSLFLGFCPFFGVTKNFKDAVAMGGALTFVMVGSAFFCWILTYYILLPFNVVYMNNVVYILVIATFVQILEMFIRRTNLRLYNAFGIYLPLITVHCAVLGITIINLREKFSFPQSMVAAVGGAFGVVILMAVMSAIRERLAVNEVPISFRGLPVAIMVACFLGLAFFGFGGMV